MTKNNLLPIGIILLTGILVFFLHSLLVSDLRFSLKNVYLFHTLASVLIYAVLLLLSLTQQFKDQIGFLYMGSLFLKVVLFAGVFYNSILSLKSMRDKEAISLLIPVFIFLFLEVYFTAKILNKSVQKT